MTKKSYQGGWVREPVNGVFKWVAVFDFSAEYPNIIRSCNMSIETHTLNPEPGKDYHIVQNTTEGWTSYYLKHPRGFVPQVVDMLINRRDEIKTKLKTLDKHDPEYQRLKMEDWSLKQVVNSLYGLFGTSFYRLSNRYIAGDITFIAREHAMYQSEVIEKTLSQWGGGNILYGDTDSTFVQLPAKTVHEALEMGRELEKRINGNMDGFARKWGWDKHFLKTKFEKLFYNWIQYAERDSKGEVKGKKRYAGFIIWEGGNTIYDPAKATVDDIHITGFEAIKRNVSPLTERVQKQIFYWIGTHPHDRPVAERNEKIVSYLRDLKKRFFAGEFDNDLLIRAVMQKPYEELNSHQAHHKAWHYANTVLGIPIGLGDAYRWVYVKGIDGYPPTEAVAIPFDMELPSYVHIDYEKMWERVVMTGPMRKILATLGIDPSLRPTHNFW